MPPCLSDGSLSALMTKGEKHLKRNRDIHTHSIAASGYQRRKFSARRAKRVKCETIVIIARSHDSARVDADHLSGSGIATGFLVRPGRRRNG